jgi:hypothetical protein
MKLNRINIFLATALLSHSSSAALKTYENTWFEIEVILFSQIGDKSRLKEVFPEVSTLPSYPKVIDLLGPYLQPDILTLKQLLPNCQQIEYPSSLINQAARLPTLFDQKTLPEIAAITAELENNSTGSDEFTAIDDYDTNLVNSSSVGSNGIANDDSNEDIQTLADSTRLQEQYILNSFQQEVDEEQGTRSQRVEASSDIQDSNNDLFEQALSHPLTQEQIALVEQAELNFSAIKLNYSPQSFTKELCALDESIFDSYRQTQPSFSYTGFPVASIDLTLDGTEDYITKQPYLISKDSLQLKSIVGQLRRSRDFKPLLHLGWRQITKLKQFAIPVHLFAGDNLNYHYQKSLDLYQQQLNESLQQEQAINGILFADQQSSELTAQGQAIQDRIELIIEQADNDDKELIQILDELDVSALALNSNDNLMLANKPLPPVQPWSIDGFLKVEVSRYLHLTADFSVVDTSLEEQATKRLQPENDLTVKSIRFQQNKRMRSNEIHYFDHPYMGMIVQIRRHKQLAPEVADGDGDRE